jgi:hypothetical protein
VGTPYWSSPNAGTALGIMIGANGSYGSPGTYYEFADTGTAIFTYTGGLSPNYGRPYNATFSVGTLALDTLVAGNIHQDTQPFAEG